MASPAEAKISLASGFPPAGEADWLRLLRKSAAGRTIPDLASESDDGIALGPVYAPVLSEEIVARRGRGDWQVVQRIDCTDVAAAVRQIEEDVAGGASAIELVFASSPSAHGMGLPAIGGRDLDKIAALLRQNARAARIDAGEETPLLTLELLRRMEADGGPRGQITAAFDPYSTMAAQGGLRRRHEELTSAVVDLAGEFERRGTDGAAFVADGRLWHAGGASEAQELSLALSAYVEALRLLEGRGIDLARGAARIGMALAAHADQFLTIAKFRAARLLVGRVLESAGVEAPLALHAETAWRMLSRHDAHTNIVRTTTASLAAGVGGADSLAVLPFDSAAGMPDRLARRLARNSQAILLREAGLAIVADPGAGAGAVETLTDRLAEKAWHLFQAIEAEGGFLTAIRAGTPQRAVAAMREKRRHRIATRALPLTGVTSYPAAASSPTDRAALGDGRAASPPPLSETVDALVLGRLAEPFEALRERAGRLAEAGSRPTVWLAVLGKPGEASALAAEVRHVFASGGMAVSMSPPLASPEMAGSAFVELRADLACICAAAKTGAQEIAATAAILKEKGAIAVGLAGQSGGSPFGIDYVIEPGTNIVELLDGILGIIAAGRQASPRTQ
jgi:methylmalonyl-CoA mutase